MNQLWRRLRRWLGIKESVAPTHVEDLPEALQPKQLYLVGKVCEPWSAALLCPCGCGAIIQLSLISDDDPRWKLSFDEGRAVTLHPSIWRIRGCGSHFFVRRNTIIWTTDRR
jgi:hypothetical protein